MLKLSKYHAIISLISVLSVLVLLHIGILLQWVPYDMVWAGRIDSVEEMYVFESISLLLNATLIILLYVKFKQLREGISSRIVDLTLWAYLLMFGLNTLGNLFAPSLLEKVLGTLFTLMAMYLCWLIVKKTPTSTEDKAP